MSMNIQKGLTAGLLSGYAGKSQFSEVIRGIFPLKQSHVEEGDLIYHDEWLDAKKGGGQEIIQVGDARFTRLYAGGVIHEDELKRIGITEDQVITFLIETIQREKENTRLFQDCCPKTQGRWSYSYTIIQTIESISLTIGVERINVDGNEVFMHAFLLCPVE
jgi:hypothetical protein